MGKVDMFMRSTQLFFLFLLSVWLAGCTHPVKEVSVPIAGGQKVGFKKVGTSFVGGEDNRFAITEAGLNPYRRSGQNFLRWQFTFRAKQPTSLRRVLVEDVSGNRPILLVDDQHPVIDGVEWSRHSGLTPATTTNAPWLYDDQVTRRIFRFTILESDGRQSVLYEAAEFNRKAKEAVRVHMGPEIPTS
jgi:hypothetical protein